MAADACQLPSAIDATFPLLPPTFAAIFSRQSPAARGYKKTFAMTK
jgi:hypothetical protein